MMIIVIIVSIIGTGTKLVGEVPCVDGYGRVNLEGIMCEDIQQTWYGLDDSYSFLTIIPVFFIMVAGI